MATKTSVKANIVYNILFQLLSLIVPLITAPYIARVIGKEGMGVYGYTYSIAHFFMLAIMLGILNYGPREIAASNYGDKESLSSKFWSIYGVQLCMGVSMMLVYLMYVYLCPDSLRYISLFWFFYLLSGTIDVSWFFFGIEEFKLTTSISAINKVLTTIAILSFVNTDKDLWLYVFIISIGCFFNGVFLWYKLKGYITLKRISLTSLAPHVMPLLVLFFPVIACNIYRYISKLLLGAMCTMSDVGIYEAAEKLINLPVCFIAAVGTVMMPYITRLINDKSTQKIKYINHASLIAVMSVSVAMTFGLLGICEVFVPLFYGSDFSQCIVVIYILAPTLIIISWANVIRTQVLLPNKKDRLFSISVACGAFVNVISNVILIPKMSVNGAAIACLIAEFTVCLIQTLYARKYINIYKCILSSAPFIVIGYVMYLLISTINCENLLFTVITRIVLGGIIYCIPAVFVLKFVTKNIPNNSIV